MLVCSFLSAYSHTRPRVERPPGLPCALCLRGREVSGKARAQCVREIMIRVISVIPGDAFAAREARASEPRRMNWPHAGRRPSRRARARRTQVSRPRRLAISLLTLRIPFIVIRTRTHRSAGAAYASGLRISAHCEISPSAHNAIGRNGSGRPAPLLRRAVGVAGSTIQDKCRFGGPHVTVVNHFRTRNVRLCAFFCGLAAVPMRSFRDRPLRAGLKHRRRKTG